MRPGSSSVGYPPVTVSEKRLSTSYGAARRQPRRLRPARGGLHGGEQQRDGRGGQHRQGQARGLGTTDKRSATEDDGDVDARHEAARPTITTSRLHPARCARPISRLVSIGSVRPPQATGGGASPHGGWGLPQRGGQRLGPLASR